MAAPVQKPHHVRQELCTTRARYREGRDLKAVKVYTINHESCYLLVQGVPSVGVTEELIKMFALYGTIEEYKILEDYPSEEFTQVVWIKFQRIQAARVAKRKMDDQSFYGGVLHVCYAPEYETVDDTRAKLADRRKAVAIKTRKLEEESSGKQPGKASQASSEEWAYRPGGSKEPRPPQNQHSASQGHPQRTSYPPPHTPQHKAQNQGDFVQNIKQVGGQVMTNIAHQHGHGDQGGFPYLPPPPRHPPPPGHHVSSRPRPHHPPPPGQHRHPPPPGHQILPPPGHQHPLSHPSHGPPPQAGTEQAPLDMNKYSEYRGSSLPNINPTVDKSLNEQNNSERTVKISSKEEVVVKDFRSSTVHPPPKFIPRQLGGVKKKLLQKHLQPKASVEPETVKDVEAKTGSGDKVNARLKLDAFVLRDVKGPQLPADEEERRVTYKITETGDQSYDTTVQEIRKRVREFASIAPPPQLVRKKRKKEKQPD